MNYKESLIAIEALANELLASIGTDATVMPHKWIGVKKQALAMLTFTKSQKAVQVHHISTIAPLPPLVNEPKPVTEEPRQLLAMTDNDKPKKRSYTPRNPTKDA